MKKIFSGYLRTDEYGFLCLEDSIKSYPHCGDSLAGLVKDAGFSGQVSVIFYVSKRDDHMDDLLEALVARSLGIGDLSVDHGLEAYSEYTIEYWCEELKIGGHDLIEELKTFEGKYLTLVIESV